MGLFSRRKKVGDTEARIKAQAKIILESAKSLKVELERFRTAINSLLSQGRGYVHLEGEIKQIIQRLEHIKQDALKLLKNAQKIARDLQTAGYHQNPISFSGIGTEVIAHDSEIVIEEAEKLAEKIIAGKGNLNSSISRFYSAMDKNIDSLTEAKLQASNLTFKRIEEVQQKQKDRMSRAA
jgi:hypothetical protein